MKPEQRTRWERRGEETAAGFGFFFFNATHDRAEEVDHGVLRPTLPRGRGGGLLRAWGEGASERSLRETGRRRVRRVLEAEKTSFTKSLCRQGDLEETGNKKRQEPGEKKPTPGFN